MAKKKRGTARKSRAVKKTNKRVTRASGKKIGLVVKNLILFIILAVASYLLQVITTPDTILNNLFYLLTIILSFVALAFLIVLLILLVMKGLKK